MKALTLRGESSRTLIAVIHHISEAAYELFQVPDGNTGLAAGESKLR